jgi:transcriptional regulator with XRE-family HTH domain
MKDPTNVTYFMRRYMGLTQEQLANETRLSANDISRIERGNFKARIEKFIKLAEYLSLPLEAILCNNLKAALAKLKAPPKVSRKMAERIRLRQEKSELTGFKGEDWVYEQEIAELSGTDYINAVNPNYADDEDAHFDILSFRRDGTPKLIEVKTTTGEASEAFYFTAGELSKAKECFENGTLYEVDRVHHIDDYDKRGRQIISAEELFNDYEFIPDTYRVVRRAS